MRYFIYGGPNEERTVWGVTFERGKPMGVDSERLALKCLGLGCFREADSEQPAAPAAPAAEPKKAEQPQRRKRGRPPKKRPLS